MGFFQAIPLRRQFIATSYFRLRIYHKSIYSNLPRFLVKQVCISSPLRAYWWSALAKPMSPQSVRYDWPWITSRYHASPRSTSLRIVVVFFVLPSERRSGNWKGGRGSTWKVFPGLVLAHHFLWVGFRVSPCFKVKVYHHPKGTTIFYLMVATTSRVLKYVLPFF